MPPILHLLAWTLIPCAVFAVEKPYDVKVLTSFIDDYVQASEYQFCCYTVVVCNARGEELLKGLSATQSKFYLMRSAAQDNVTEWNVSLHPQGFILDMRCSNTRNLLSQAAELNLLRRPYSWLLLSNEGSDVVDRTENLTEMGLMEVKNDVSSSALDLSWFKDINLRYDSLVVVAEFTSPTQVIMTEYYKIRPDMEVIRNVLGGWSSIHGIQFVSSQVMTWRRRDLRGIVITATIVINHDESMDHLESHIDTHHDSASRLSYSIITGMAKVFNASIDLVKTDTWGALGGEGWTGMVGDLLSEKAELGSCPLFLTQQRMEVVDYLQGTSQARTAFIATAPPLSYSSNLFSLPFSGGVWICSVALIVVTSFLLYVTTKIENEAEGLQVLEKDTLGANWSDIFMLNLGAICQQGCDAEPKGPSGRIVTLILYLAVMFLFVSYSASIVALLQSSDTSIKTIKNLLDSPLQCGAENIPYQRFWFKAALDPRGDPVRREFYLKKIAPKGEDQANFLTIEEGIRKVRQGLYAFHVEVSPGYQVVQQTFTESEKCGLQELPSFIVTPEPWIPMQKNSPLSEVFKIGVKIAREVGIESRATNRLYTKKPPCSAPGSNFVSVGLVDVYVLFLWLTYGLVSSMVLVVLERLIYIRLKRRVNIKPWAKQSINPQIFDRAEDTEKLRRI